MRLPRSAPAALAASALLTAGCDAGLVGEPGGQGSPTARLAADPVAGQAPHAVTLDASASEPFIAGGALRFHFDVDGDGTFEGEAPTEEATVAHTFALPGTFSARVRVIGEDGRFDEATVEIEVVGQPPDAELVADIDVDTNRDGAVNGVDEIDEDAFGPSAGAVLLANVDDDDLDGTRDSRDAELTGEQDREDLATARVARVLGLDGHTVRLRLEPPAARERVRVWRDGATPTVLIDPEDASGEAVIDGANEDVALLLEALVPRTVEWDGTARLVLTVEDGADVVSEDVAVLRAAPVIFPDNLQTPVTLYVMDIPGDNGPLVDALRANMPARAELYTLDDDSYGYDRWVQDNMELGYQSAPSTDDPVVMRTAMQLERQSGYGGLDQFVPFEYLAPGAGYLYPGGAPSSHNYGGNLEVAPPVDGFPFGRMLFGGGNGGTLLGQPSSDRMNDDQVGFLDAQEIQGPALMLSSEWLAVGHIDEIFQFVPDLTPDGAHAFKVVIASPTLARDTLLAVQSRGGGALRVFPGRERAYSVDEILQADEFLALNEAAQARIDGVTALLSRELGLGPDDVRPVPVLYEEVGGGLVAAFNPGVQNLVTMGDRVFVPDPEGPNEGGADAWQEATRAALADTDLDVIFVDVFESYHLLLGEAHCGTNVDRVPYATPWWTDARGAP